MKSRVPRGLILAIIIVIVSLGPVFIRLLDSFNGFDHPNGSVDQDIDTTPLGNYINSTVIGNGNETNRDHETEVDLPTGYVVGTIIDIELKTGMSVLIIEDTSKRHPSGLQRPTLDMLPRLPSTPSPRIKNRQYYLGSRRM